MPFANAVPSNVHSRLFPPPNASKYLARLTNNLRYRGIFECTVFSEPIIAMSIHSINAIFVSLVNKRFHTAFRQKIHKDCPLITIDVKNSHLTQIRHNTNHIIADDKRRIVPPS